MPMFRFGRRDEASGFDQSGGAGLDFRRRRHAIGGAQHCGNEERWHQRDEQLREHGAFCDAGTAASGECSPQPRQRVAALLRQCLREGR